MVRWPAPLPCGGGPPKGAPGPEGRVAPGAPEGAPGDSAVAAPANPPQPKPRRRCGGAAGGRLRGRGAPLRRWLPPRGGRGGGRAARHVAPRRSGGPHPRRRDVPTPGVEPQACLKIYVGGN